MSFSCIYVTVLTRRQYLLNLVSTVRATVSLIVDGLVCGSTARYILLRP